MGRLKKSGYKNMWSTWIHHNLSPNHDREKLQIVQNLLDRWNWQENVDFMQQLREKATLIVVPCRRTAAKSKKVWLKALQKLF